MRGKFKQRFDPYSVQDVHMSKNSLEILREMGLRRGYKTLRNLFHTPL